ncbi:sigma-70 family RNA polymerase sigma factor [Demequina sp.]|uniref:sigma-70 family RNA polymerase sigma factor n=1 Tax=Demequina sp. TaxID=2050685 RepID=UPI003A8C2284
MTFPVSTLHNGGNDVRVAGPSALCRINVAMDHADEEVRSLVEANFALVGYCVNEIAARVPSHVSRSDLASAGSYALVLAARAYDAHKGVPFARYASMRIRGALVDELRSMDWVPRSARRRARDVSSVVETLTGQLGRAPSTAQVAQTLGITEAEVLAARVDLDSRVLSMDAFDSAVAHSVVDPAVTPAEALLGAEQVHYLRAGVQALPEKLRHVVEELFFRDRPVAELAEEMGVTRSRISQLRTEALTLLKDGMRSTLDADAAPVVDPDAGVAVRRRQAFYAAMAARASEAGHARTVVPMRQAALPPEDAVRIG